LPALPLPVNKAVVHEKDGIAGRGGEQPHGGTEPFVHRGVYSLLDAAPVLRVLGVQITVAQVQSRDRRLVGRLLGLAAGEAGRAVGADEDRRVGKGLDE